MKLYATTTSALLFIALTAAAGDAIKLSDDGTKIRVDIGGRHFTDYNYVTESNAPTLTQFFYPLKAQDGTELASDQFARKLARLPEADHPHHRALRFSHLYQNLSRDYWHQTRHHHKRFTKVEGDTFIEELEWEGAAQAPAPELREQRAFRFISFPDGTLGMDVTLTYRPGARVPTLLKPTTWANQSNLVFATMVIRTVPELGNNGVISLAGGRTTDTRKGASALPLDAWRTSWIDLSGTLHEKKYGITFIAHPENPYPTVWRRDYLYWGIQANIEAPNGISLGDGQSLTMRYRVLVHLGENLEGKTLASNETRFRWD